MHSQQLIDRLTNGTATIGVVGLGYVGLPLVLRYCEKGYKTIGFDVDARKVEKLGQAQSYIEHISSADIAAANEAGFEATTDMARIDDVLDCWDDLHELLGQQGLRAGP